MTHVVVKLGLLSLSTAPYSKAGPWVEGPTPDGAFAFCFHHFQPGSPSLVPQHLSCAASQGEVMAVPGTLHPAPCTQLRAAPLCAAWNSPSARNLLQGQSPVTPASIPDSCLLSEQSPPSPFDSFSY